MAMVNLSTVHEDVPSEVSELRNEKLEQSLNTKVKDFSDYVRSMLQQVVEAAFKRSTEYHHLYEELKLDFLVMKDEVEEYKKHQKKLVTDMSHVHDKLSNLQSLVSEGCLHQCETDNHIQRLQRITDAPQTNLSLADTNCTKLDLDALRLHQKMQDTPGDATLEFTGEVPSMLQIIRNDLHSLCTGLLSEQDQRQEAKVHALQSTVDIMRGDIQGLDTKLLDTQKVFSQTISEVARTVIQLDKTRKGSWHEKPVSQRRMDNLHSATGVVDLSTSESLFVHTDALKGSCDDSSLKFERMGQGSVQYTPHSTPTPL